MSVIYAVKYTGPFGFIKPWTAVRDEATFSSQIITPSMIEGIRQKLEVDEISGHRLNYDEVSEQQETVQAAAWAEGKTRNRGILTRGVMVNPVLWLRFKTQEEANRAFNQHIVLSRNEDILHPVAIQETTLKEFNSEIFPGFEFIEKKKPAKNEESLIPVGINRYTGKLMQGVLTSYGKGLDL